MAAATIAVHHDGPYWRPLALLPAVLNVVHGEVSLDNKAHLILSVGARLGIEGIAGRRLAVWGFEVANSSWVQLVFAF
jgi:hypothetical protein